MGKNNVVLIGMPGCGKSTIGVVLAKTLGYDFIDSDLLIQNTVGKRLDEIIKQYGDDEFRNIEEKVNMSIDTENTVIATGGSVIYGAEAMKHLKSIGTVVFIKLGCDELAMRLGDLKERGVTIREGQTLYDLFEERRPFYEMYADITVDTSGMEIRDAMEKIRDEVRGVQK